MLAKRLDWVFVVGRLVFLLGKPEICTSPVHVSLVCGQIWGNMFFDETACYVGPCGEVDFLN